ncbi:glycerol-3-phosphate acyltransferase [Paenibacillus sp. N3.4]|uniref:glycerol-3-phosphate acyltransferase n=1 Tax=Paenibacillus sp. N3.4 TaxID=2603222 RepID=UPI0011C7327F|nr:glycerol-3-phosphate acyltransferase [Paenibacillus sp. N3.4]TXK83683.1 glycerol-3-phosphate acyltransferase [Paenibacillus sp. N3.4]
MMILWTACAFLSGSLMFSYWLGLFSKRNLKTIGDGNPGALNLWRAAGYQWGLAGIVLDFIKGYLPVMLLMQNANIHGYKLIPIALAPVIGHAFSPFLRGKGGKAIAITFGVWSALTSFEVSLVLAVILAIFLVAAKWITNNKPISSETDGFQVVAADLLVVIYIFARGFPSAIIWTWLGNFLLLVYTHKYELARFYKKVGKGSKGGNDAHSS